MEMVSIERDLKRWGVVREGEILRCTRCGVSWFLLIDPDKDGCIPIGYGLCPSRCALRAIPNTQRQRNG